MESPGCRALCLVRRNRRRRDCFRGAFPGLADTGPRGVDSKLKVRQVIERVKDAEYVDPVLDRGISEARDHVI